MCLLFWPREGPHGSGAQISEVWYRCLWGGPMKLLLGVGKTTNWNQLQPRKGMPLPWQNALLCDTHRKRMQTGRSASRLHPLLPAPESPSGAPIDRVNQGTNLQRRNLVSESQLRPEKRDVHQGGDSQIISSLSINKKGHCDHGLEVIYWQWLTSFRARKHFHPLWKYT